MTVLDFETRLLLKRAVSNRIRQLRVVAEDEGTCAACDTPWSLPTPGCRTCQDRERRKSKREALRPERPVTGACAGCGIHWDRYTVGCRSCMDRRRRRREAA